MTRPHLDRLAQPPRRTGPRLAARAMAVLVTLMVGAVLGVAPAQAGTFYLNTCGYSGSPDPFSAGAGGGINVGAACGGGGTGYQISSPGGVGFNASANWSTTAPAGITIDHVYTQNDLSNNIQGAGYYTSFNWDGGTTGQLPNSFGQGQHATGCCTQNFSTQHLSWAMTCRWSTCSKSAYMDIGSLTVTLTENQAPSITGGGSLWSSSGWVRGVWGIGFGASDPSGVCSSSVALGGQTIGGPGGAPNQGAYHQCPDQLWGTNIDTSQSTGSAGRGAGSMGLGIAATNAAGVTGFIARTVDVDNDSPSVSISGPSYALASAGTQYLTARASAGPSGVRGISCSVDGGGYQYTPGATALVAVSGAGVHSTTCVSYNNAVDASGNVAGSAPAHYTTDISFPTLSSIWFATLRNPLRCKLVRVRVKVPAHYRYVKRHHHRVRVRVRAHYRYEKSHRCTARVVRRRIAYWVTVRRHHHRVRVKRYRYVRSVEFPTIAHSTVRHVRYGKRVRLQGWLGSTWLAPLPGQPVAIYAAVDNEQGNFGLVGYARTGSDGVWTFTLPPGPSRIIEVSYPGALGGAITSSVSGQITLRVQAHIHLVRVPRGHAHWGQTLRFKGYLAGGYIPRNGAFLRVRVGYGSSFNTTAAFATRRNGTFAWTLHLGTGPPGQVERFWYQFVTLGVGDYPYTPGKSRRVYITVS